MFGNSDEIEKMYFEEYDFKYKDKYYNHHYSLQKYIVDKS